MAGRVGYGALRGTSLRVNDSHLDDWYDGTSRVHYEAAQLPWEQGLCAEMADDVSEDPSGYSSHTVFMRS